jgi:hypothetical protein
MRRGKLWRVRAIHAASTGRVQVWVIERRLDSGVWRERGALRDHSAAMTRAHVLAVDDFEAALSRARRSDLQ